MNTAIAISAAALVTAISNAAISSYPTYAAWAGAVGNPNGNVFPGMTGNVVSDPMDSNIAGEDAPAFFGSAGPAVDSVDWAIRASVGSVVSTIGGFRASSSGASLIMEFSLDVPGRSVQGIGGNFRLMDASNNFVDGAMRVQLGNGTAMTKTFTATSSFAGFWSNNLAAPITSITIRPLSSTPGEYRVAVENIYVGTVPSPGPIALVLTAGVVAVRRRRA